MFKRRAGRDTKAVRRDVGTSRPAGWTMAILVVASGAVLVPATAASARMRHQRRAHAVARPIAQTQPHSFYPENVPGGVPGNLPFNNQIRKLTDPLNANGAGH